MKDRQLLVGTVETLDPAVPGVVASEIFQACEKTNYCSCCLILK